MYQNFLIFFDINQSELSIPSQVNFVVLSNQNGVFTDFEVFYRSEQSYVYEPSQSIVFTIYSCLKTTFLF